VSTGAQLSVSKRGWLRSTAESLPLRRSLSRLVTRAAIRVRGPSRALAPPNSHSRNTGAILAMELAGFDITDVMHVG
jgi:hypothetical protein